MGMVLLSEKEAEGSAALLKEAKSSPRRQQMKTSGSPRKKKLQGRLPLKDSSPVAVVSNGGGDSISPSPREPQKRRRKSKGKENKEESEAATPTSLTSTATPSSNGTKVKGRKKTPLPPPSAAAAEDGSKKKKRKPRKKKVVSSPEGGGGRHFPLIKAFRKSPVKFDPSRLKHPHDDPVDPSPPSKARKRAVKKKLDLEASPSSTVNRRSNIVPGDYLSHGRQYFHVQTNGGILHGEPESQESYQWIPDLMVRQIDDFLDLNAGEKELIKLWNEYVIREPAYGSEMLASRLRAFVEDQGRLLAYRGLYKNFILHLSNLYDHEVLEQSVFLELVLRIQTLMAELEEQPWRRQWIEKSKEEVKPSSLRVLPPKKHFPRPTHRPNTTSKTKKRRQKSGGGKSRRRASLRGLSGGSSSSVLKMTSDVSVKFWGAGDYTSIKDAIPLPSFKRKFDVEDLRSVIESKRRKIAANGHFSTNNSSSFTDEVT